MTTKNYNDTSINLKELKRLIRLLNKSGKIKEELHIPAVVLLKLSNKQFLEACRQNILVYGTEMQISIINKKLLRLNKNN